MMMIIINVFTNIIDERDLDISTGGLRHFNSIDERVLEIFHL